MIAAGALIGVGVLEFWPTLLAAVAGAILGDGISYWLGHHYRGQLRSVWPFSRHPEWLIGGENFFRRHGGKSVLIGRFVGPVRPIVPVVAGMLGMRAWTFYGVNVLSAIAWAPAYLLPGMAFGASLALAGVVAARLVVMLVVLLASTWILVWLIRWGFRALSPRAAWIADRVLSWGGSHPRVNRLFGSVLDPARPETMTLLLIGAVLIGSTWLFLGVLEDVVTGDPLVRADGGVYQLMQGLRTPSGDRVMVFFTELGDGVLISIVAATVLAWLCWRRCWRSAAYWVMALGFGQLAVSTIKLALQRSRPLADLYEGPSSFAFPSGHATMSMVAYGFLAALIAGRVPRPRRWIVYALAASLICAIAASRLYLGAHWLSDVVGGLSLGLAWVCLLAISYYRHPRPTENLRGLPAVALIAFGVAAGGHVTAQYSNDLLRYAPTQQGRHLDITSWWQKEWQRMPIYRQDLEGKFEQPFNLQWAGDLLELRQTLNAHGWREPVPVSFRTALRWLAPDEPMDKLPLLPRVHDGRHEVLQMIYPLSANEQDSRRLVLRLWATSVTLDPAGSSLWIGTVSYQKLEHLALMRIPVGDQQYDEGLAVLADSLKTAGVQSVQKLRSRPEIRTDWSGEVLLLKNP